MSGRYGATNGRCRCDREHVDRLVTVGSSVTKVRLTLFLAKELGPCTRPRCTMSSIPRTRTTTRRRSERARAPAQRPRPGVGTGSRHRRRRGRGAGRRGRPRRPAGQHGGGVGRAVARVARRRGVVPRADVRRAPQLPGRRTGAARRAVRRVRQQLAGHLRPERRRHLRGAAPDRLDRAPDRLRRGRRRRLHERRVPVQPPGPDAGPRCARARAARKAADPGVRRQPLLGAEVRAADGPRRRQRGVRADRRAAPDGPGRPRPVARRLHGARPATDGDRRDGRHDRLRIDRPAARDRRPGAGLRHLAARRRGVRRWPARLARATGIGSPGSTAPTR